MLTVVRQDVKNRELVVRTASKAGDISHIVGHPGDRTELVLWYLVDLLEVDDVLEQSRILHRRQREWRQSIIVAYAE